MKKLLIGVAMVASANVAHAGPSSACLNASLRLYPHMVEALAAQLHITPAAMEVIMMSDGRSRDQIITDMASGYGGENDSICKLVLTLPDQSLPGLAKMGVAKFMQGNN